MRAGMLRLRSRATSSRLLAQRSPLPVSRQVSGADGRPVDADSLLDLLLDEAEQRLGGVELAGAAGQAGRQPPRLGGDAFVAGLDERLGAEVLAGARRRRTARSSARRLPPAVRPRFRPTRNSRRAPGTAPSAAPARCVHSTRRRSGCRASGGLCDQLARCIAVVEQVLPIEVQRRGRPQPGVSLAGALDGQRHLPGPRPDGPAHLVAQHAIPHHHRAQRQHRQRGRRQRAKGRP